MVLGHAGSVEVCTRQLLGKTPRPDQDFRVMCSEVPYCGLILIEEDKKHKKWTVQDCPIGSITHSQNKKEDPRKRLYPR